MKQPKDAKSEKAKTKAKTTKKTTKTKAKPAKKVEEMVVGGLEGFSLEKIEEIKQQFQETTKSELTFNKNEYFLEEGELISIKPVKPYPKVVDGIAFIGDPHIWSKRPGRRLDVSFTDTVIDKLDQIATYCNKHNLLPLILGDLFDRENDNDVAMLGDLITVLRKFNNPVITAEGNHDKSELRLTKHNPLIMLEKAGVLSIMKDNGLAYSVMLKKDIEGLSGSGKVLIGATPYGYTIPDNVLNLSRHLAEFARTGKRKGNVFIPLTDEQQEEIERQEKANKTSGNIPIYRDNQFSEKDYANVEEFKLEQGIEEIIWITHHDLAMNGAYPNSIALKEILGVDRVINGHIHGCKESVKMKNTVYYNKGNITRLKIDQINDKPAIWTYSLLDDEQEASITGVSVKALKPFYLNVKDGREVFRLKHNDTEDGVSEEEIERMTQSAKEKLFVEMLEEKEHEEKTDDGAIVEESLAGFLEESQVSDELRAEILNLFSRVQGKV